MNRPSDEANFTQTLFLPETLWSTRSETTLLYAERFRGPRSSPAADRHPFYELTVVLNGTGKLHIGNSVQELLPESAVFLPPGTPHREEAAGNLDTIWIGFRSPLPELAGLKSFVLESHRTAETALACWKLAAPRIPGTGFELDGTLLALIGILLRSRKEEHASWQETIFDYLESHCHEECSIGALARRFHCSESYFSSAAYGAAALRNCSALRICRSLLSEPSLPQADGDDRRRIPQKVRKNHLTPRKKTVLFLSKSTRSSRKRTPCPRNRPENR